MLHHLDLNVSNPDQAQAFYGPLLTRLGYQPGDCGAGWAIWEYEGGPYLTLVQTEEPYRHQGFHRKRVGVNHLAFAAPSREAVMDLHRWLVDQGVAILYGGPMEMGTPGAPNFAVFFEDPDRLKLEYVYRPAGL